MKIKYSKLPELKTLTNKELDFFFYLVRYQDETGKVLGVHNQELCQDAGMCKQSFYTCMRSLEKKNIITVEKNTESDYDITILGNDFSGNDAYEKGSNNGYIQMNRPIFQDAKFTWLKGKEKLMVLELFKRTNYHNHSYCVGVKKFYEVFCEILDVKERVLRYYLKSMKRFFSIGVKEGKFYITYLHSVFKGQMGQDSITKVRNCYFVRMVLRRNKIQATMEEMRDTAALLNQYIRTSGLSLNQLKKLLSMAVIKTVKGLRPIDRMLQPKYVHKTFLEQISGMQPGMA